MSNTMTHAAASLIAFRDRVEAAFLDRRIRCPVHLPSDGQAEPLLRIFEDVRPQDWVFSGWRSMWHGLLKGIPEEELFQMILDGRSMYLMDKHRHFVCSSIVGGVLPIALGVAAGIKRWYEGLKEYADKAKMGFENPKPSRVWVFSGDMTARSGLFHETLEYAKGHALPMRFVQENNGLSTDTPTEAAWGDIYDGRSPEMDYYSYDRNKPHVGVGTHVSFF